MPRTQPDDADVRDGRCSVNPCILSCCRGRRFCGYRILLAEAVLDRDRFLVYSEGLYL